MIKSGFAGSHAVAELLECAPGPRTHEEAHHGAQRAGQIGTEELSRRSQAELLFAFVLQYAKSNQCAPILLARSCALSAPWTK
jgi:hypothetical protein